MKLSVIVPVGPGHQQVASQAIQSAEMAWETAKGPFNAIEIVAIDDTDGGGRSAARNLGRERSAGDWLFYLDADDLMFPRALKNAQPYLRDYDAVWGLILELRGSMAVERQGQIRKIRDFARLRRHDPFLTLQIGHFVRADRALPFDETLNVGEDFEYYLRTWKAMRCIKAPVPLYVNRRGRHAANSPVGGVWREVVSRMLKAA